MAEPKKKTERKGQQSQEKALPQTQASASAAVRRGRWRAAAVLLFVVFAAFGLVRLYQTPFLAIESVEVRGPVEALGLEEVVNAVKSSLQGNMLTADIGRVKKAVEDISWIKSAEVARLWPDALHVEVVRHKAVAIFEDGRLVSDEGVLFSSNDEPIDRLMAMPTFSGDPQYVSEAVRLLPLFEKQAERLSAKVKAVDATFRGSWSIVIESAQFDAMKIELGRALTKNGPAVRLAQVVDNLPEVAEMMQGYPERIDARYKDAFAARIPTPSAQQRWLASHPQARAGTEGQTLLLPQQKAKTGQKDENKEKGSGKSDNKQKAKSISAAKKVDN